VYRHPLTSAIVIAAAQLVDQPRKRLLYHVHYIYRSSKAHQKHIMSIALILFVPRKLPFAEAENNPSGGYLVINDVGQHQK
jgi:hypothetical protein